MVLLVEILSPFSSNFPTYMTKKRTEKTTATVSQYMILTVGRAVPAYPAAKTIKLERLNTIELPRMIASIFMANSV